MGQGLHNSVFQGAYSSCRLLDINTLLSWGATVEFMAEAEVRSEEYHDVGLQV